VAEDRVESSSKPVASFTMGQNLKILTKKKRSFFVYFAQNRLNFSKFYEIRP
jgi:hypothetical protein